MGRGRLYAEGLPTSKNELLFGDTVTFRFGEMRRELFPCLPIDSTAKDGTIDGEDFNPLLTMRAMDKNHKGDLPTAFRQSVLPLRPLFRHLFYHRGGFKKFSCLVACLRGTSRLPKGIRAFLAPLDPCAPVPTSFLPAQRQASWHEDGYPQPDYCTLEGRLLRCVGIRERG